MMLKFLALQGAPGMYMCVYIHTHTHTYIHTHIQAVSRLYIITAGGDFLGLCDVKKFK
jgi:hypothetical protein